MWIMILLLPMAHFIRLCVNVLPPKYQRIPPSIGWFLIIPCLAGVSIPLIRYLERSPMSPLNSIMILAGALSSYYVIRATSFLGLLLSYSLYGNDKSIPTPKATAALAWAVSLLEPLAVAGIFGMAFFTGYPGKLDVRGMKEVMLFVTMILTGGIGLSYVYLMGLFSRRNAIRGVLKPAAQATASSAKIQPAGSQAQWKKPIHDPRAATFRNHEGPLKKQ